MSNKRKLSSEGKDDHDALDIEQPPSKKRKLNSDEVQAPVVAVVNKLCTITPAIDVSDDYKSEAKTWSKWDSKDQKRFPYIYKVEEKVLVLEGSATLTPDDGSDAIYIKTGDAVTFHAGFKCKWEITKQMKKHYAVFPEDGAEDVPAIACDICGVGCVAESYFVEDGELDICVECYKKDTDKYKGAEHQKNGEKW
eukprot:CAMPEP_0202690328 /NCGR_PEP_ID=MMETSP1385-20130828/5339_1 /ASSEMBLY_ACC=CAM_ASM_000861 /TAXON_ID=933848 /ORGANISM="Elphidium margaritaceum" /LENGTH=194 /DNA_ID=CAMNT_0049345571 /DNA_START=26 /DNA_END=607 /DNA_ORIENTATION=+